MYVWHKEAQSRKFLVLHETPRSYQVDDSGGGVLSLPKEEYVCCTPPLAQWRDVTENIEIDNEGAVWIQGKILLHPPAHVTGYGPLRLVKYFQDPHWIIRFEELY